MSYNDAGAIDADGTNTKSINAEGIVKALTERFDGLSLRVQRENRIWLEACREGFIDLLRYLHDELGFITLCTISGVDTGEEFQLIYHLSHSCGIVLSARTSAPHADPTFDTATDIYKGGMLYELEARNLLGLDIRGIPKDIIYPLPDGWPKGQYPLRKSWVKLDSNDADGANNADDAAGNVAVADAAGRNKSASDKEKS